MAEKMLNECGWILTCKCGTNASASGSHLLAPPVMTSCVMLQVVYLYICDYALAFWCICIMWHHHTALWIDANWLIGRSSVRKICKTLNTDFARQHLYPWKQDTYFLDPTNF